MILQKLKVDGQHIERLNSLNLVADSRNFIGFQFAFSPEWAGVAKTAIITTGGATYHCLIGVDGAIAPGNMPVLRAGECTVSVFGGDLYTVGACTMAVGESGLRGGATPIAPPPDIYSQITALADGANNHASAAMLDAAKAKTDAGNALAAANDTQNAAALAAKAAQAAQAAADADATKTTADAVATAADRIAAQKSATEAAAQVTACQTAVTKAATDVAAQVSAAIGVQLDTLNGEVI